MSDRNLEIQFPSLHCSWPISLYWDSAPKTCKALWKALEEPARMQAVHAMFAGPEIMMGLPPASQTFDPGDIPCENQTCFPGAGECLWYFQRENHMKGLPDEFWEVGVFYDSGGRIFGPLGWTPCNIFGRIAANLSEFQHACASLRLKGAQELILSRSRRNS